MALRHSALPLLHKQLRRDAQPGAPLANALHFSIACLEQPLARCTAHADIAGLLLRVTALQLGLCAAQLSLLTDLAVLQLRNALTGAAGLAAAAALRREPANASAACLAFVLPVCTCTYQLSACCFSV